MPQQVKDTIVSDVRYFSPSIVDEINMYEDLDQRRIARYVVDQETKGKHVTVQELREDRTGKKEHKVVVPNEFSEKQTMTEHSNLQYMKLVMSLSKYIHLTKKRLNVHVVIDGLY